MLRSRKQPDPEVLRINFPGILSRDFESDEFRRFCKACYHARRVNPTLTLRGLRAALAVAASPEPMSYERLATRLGQSYGVTAIQAAILSDGRGSQCGLNLLRRVPGHDRKTRLLVPSETGRALGRMFASVTKAVDDDPSIDEAARMTRSLETRTIPALHMAVHEMPESYLVTLCVLLFIAQNNLRFAHHGVPVSIIQDEIKVNNLPRHLTTLASARSKLSGDGLIHLNKNGFDRRVILPELSDSGLTLVSNIAAALQSASPSPVRQPKVDSLRKATSADDIRNFGDEDFDVINIEKLESFEIPTP